MKTKLHSLTSLIIMVSAHGRDNRSLAAVMNLGSAVSPTLVAKHTSQGLLWVGDGCRVHVVNITDISTSLDESIVASTDNISPFCETGFVSSLGISADGHIAIIGTQTSETLFLLKLDIFAGVYSLTRFSGITLPGGFGAVRIGNSVRNSVGSSELLYLAAQNTDTEGLVLALSLDPSNPSVSVLATFSVESPDVHDVQVISTDTSSVVATCRDGLVMLRLSSLDGSFSFTLTGFLPMEYSGNDGLSITNDGFAIVAAQGSGLLTMNLISESECGHIKVEGWAGGVGLSSDQRTVLVAADPGLVAIDISSRCSPKPMWTCYMGGGGVGWNIDVDAERCLAYVSDYDGGLQVVSFCNGDKGPKAEAHFGSGSLASCNNLQR
jgi:hypothetical protein